MTILNIFANQSGQIPLSELDTNFATPITIGTTPIILGQTAGTITGLTLAGANLGTPTGNLANCTFPILNQNTTGTASNVTGVVAVGNGGTGATTNAGTAYALKGANADITSMTGLGTAILDIGSGQIYKDASGNVGIGTSSPASKLHVYGGAGTAIGIQSSAGNQWRIGDAIGAANGTLVTYDYTNSQHVWDYASGAAGYHTLYTAGLARMQIDSSGNLLVGTTTQASTAKISVDGSVGATTGYLCHAGTSAGNVFGNAFNFFWTGSALQAWVDATNVGNVTLVSDYRIKKDIVTQDTPAIARINQLRPVTYERTDYKEIYKADGVAREGFIAHELQAIIPSAVEGEKDCENQIQSLNLDALCSVMVKAIQEQQTLIESLTARLTALEAK